MKINKVVNPKDLSQHLAKDRKTAVIFVLSTCPFCNAFKPSFYSFADARPNDFSYLEAVLDYESPLWDTYEIAAVPTIIVFENGKIVKRLDSRPGVCIDEKDLELL